MRATRSHTKSVNAAATTRVTCSTSRNSNLPPTTRVTRSQTTNSNSGTTTAAPVTASRVGKGNAPATTRPTRSRTRVTKPPAAKRTTWSRTKKASPPPSASPSGSPPPPTAPATTTTAVGSGGPARRTRSNFRGTGANFEILPATKRARAKHDETDGGDADESAANPRPTKQGKLKRGDTAVAPAKTKSRKEDAVVEEQATESDAATEDGKGDIEVDSEPEIREEVDEVVQHDSQDEDVEMSDSPSADDLGLSQGRRSRGLAEMEAQFEGPPEEDSEVEKVTPTVGQIEVATALPATVNAPSASSNATVEQHHTVELDDLDQTQGRRSRRLAGLDAQLQGLTEESEPEQETPTAGLVEVAKVPLAPTVTAASDSHDSNEAHNTVEHEPEGASDAELADDETSDSSGLSVLSDADFEGFSYMDEPINKDLSHDSNGEEGSGTSEVKPAKKPMPKEAKAFFSDLRGFFETRTWTREDYLAMRLSPIPGMEDDFAELNEEEFLYYVPPPPEGEGSENNPPEESSATQKRFAADAYAQAMSKEKSKRSAPKEKKPPKTFKWDEEQDSDMELLEETKSGSSDEEGSFIMDISSDEEEVGQTDTSAPNNDTSGSSILGKQVVRIPRYVARRPSSPRYGKSVKFALDKNKVINQTADSDNTAGSDEAEVDDLNEESVKQQEDAQPQLPQQRETWNINGVIIVDDTEDFDGAQESEPAVQDEDDTEAAPPPQPQRELGADGKLISTKGMTVSETISAWQQNKLHTFHREGKAPGKAWLPPWQQYKDTK